MYIHTSNCCWSFLLPCKNFFNTEIQRFGGAQGYYIPPGGFALCNPVISVSLCCHLTLNNSFHPETFPVNTNAEGLINAHIIQRAAEMIGSRM